MRRSFSLTGTGNGSLEESTRGNKRNISSNASADALGFAKAAGLTRSRSWNKTSLFAASSVALHEDFDLPFRDA